MGRDSLLLRLISRDANTLSALLCVHGTFFTLKAMEVLSAPGSMRRECVLVLDAFPDSELRFRWFRTGWFSLVFALRSKKNGCSSACRPQCRPARSFHHIPRPPGARQFLRRLSACWQARALHCQPCH